jgi:hypothetical protein
MALTSSKSTTELFSLSLSPDKLKEALAAAMMKEFVAELKATGTQDFLNNPQVLDKVMDALRDKADHALDGLRYLHACREDDILICFSVTYGR